MGRGREGEYYRFCVDHVRQYNQTYNYFDGMNDSQVDEFRKDALTGHRPTWKVGANAWAHGTRDNVRSAEAAAHIRSGGAAAARALLCAHVFCQIPRLTPSTRVTAHPMHADTIA